MIIPEGRGGDLEFRDSKPYLDYEARMKAEDERYIFGPQKPPHPPADNQAIVNCHACTTPVLETVDEDGTPTYATIPREPMPDIESAVTPRELIEMLGKWEQDKPFEVFMQNNPLNGPFHPIILRQGMNSINLTGKD